MQYAGGLAARYQRPFGFKADTTGNWFKVFDTNPGSDPPVDVNGVVQNPFDKNWYAKDFNAGSPYYGVQIVAVPAGGAVQFYPDGHSGAADSSFTVKYGGRQKTITVSGITGRITVQ